MRDNKFTFYVMERSYTNKYIKRLQIPEVKPTAPR